MKIERILYGMQTANGKILSKYSSGVNQLLQPKSRESIKTLKIDANKKYLWFKTEQTIAYPVIIEVADKEPSHGGRTWVQNQTFLVNIHEFVEYVQSGKNPFEAFESLVQPELENFPDQFDPVTV